jgi:hypothetical protein
MARSLEHQLSRSGGVVTEVADAAVLRGETRGPAALFQGHTASGAPVVLLRQDVATTQLAGAALPTADYVLWGGDANAVCAVSVASPNKYIREAQQLPERMLEGMCRRTAMVMGVDPSAVRARTLLLPPTVMDRRSLERLHAALRVTAAAATNANAADEAVASASPSLSVAAEHALREIVPPQFAGWVSLYRADLAAEDVDYAAQADKKPEEEYVKL